MRSRTRTLVVGIGSFFLAASLVTPSFAAKKVISDDELDNVTAAGEPTIITTAGTTSSVTFTATTTASFAASGTAQNALRALILNNVVGENQLANGVNIQQNGTTQTNTISQSWGAIADITAVTVAGISAAGGSASACTGAVTIVCGIGVVKVQGGNSATSPGSSTVLSNTADVVISTTGTSSQVTYNPVNTFSIAVSDSSQAGLVALIVNNVAGLNQVANGLNISAFGTVVTGGGITLGSGGGATVGAQTNTITQYNGTPANWTRH